MKRLEVRLLPAKQLIGYLVDEFHAVEQGDGTVTGEGWTARFTPGEHIALGEFTRVPVLFIEFDGPRESVAANFMMQMTMRGGG